VTTSRRHSKWTRSVSGEKFEFAFDRRRAPVRFRDPEPKTVLVYWPRGDAPEFHQGLWHEALVAAMNQRAYFRANETVFTVIRIDESQQNIRIEEDAHSISRDPGRCSRG
jgi:hypothetical protein